MDLRHCKLENSQNKYDNQIRIIWKVPCGTASRIFGENAGNIIEKTVDKTSQKV